MWNNHNIGRGRGLKINRRIFRIDRIRRLLYHKTIVPLKHHSVMSVVKSSVITKKLTFKNDKAKFSGSNKVQRDKVNTFVGTSGNDNHEPIVKNEEIIIHEGTGRICSSTTTIQGNNTKFQSELAIGDAIIVTHPTTLQQETKIVRMVLSDVNIGVSSGFSSDLISMTTFKYIKAPKDDIDEEIKLKNEKKQKIENEALAFGSYANSYRVRKEGAFGGYQIIKETNVNKSRGDLLNDRMRKKSDKYCF